MNFVVTRHALERFREHVPGAERVDVLMYISHGQPESPDMVQTLTGRMMRQTTDQYVVSPNQRGIFVISTYGTVITYLRMGDAQQNILKPATLPVEPVAPPVKPAVNILGFADEKTYMHKSVHAYLGSTENAWELLREPVAVEKTDLGLVFSLKGESFVGVLGGSETVTVYTTTARKEMIAQKQARQAEREALYEQVHLQELTARYKDWISSPP